MVRVLAEVPPGRVRCTGRDGRGPLCAFLGMPVPDAPNPSANATDGFRKAAAEEDMIPDSDATG